MWTGPERESRVTSMRMRKASQSEWTSECNLVPEAVDKIENWNQKNLGFGLIGCMPSCSITISKHAQKE